MNPPGAGIEVARPGSDPAAAGSVPATAGFVSASVVRSPVELAVLLPSGVELVVTGLGVLGHEPEELDRIDVVLPRAVRALARDGAAAVFVAALPHSAWRGRVAERALYDAVSEEAGVPVISAGDAIVAALRRAGAHRPALVTAYRDATNEGLIRYLADAELEVAGAHGLQAAGPAASARLLSPAFVAAAVELREAHPDADAIVLGVRAGGPAVAAAVAGQTGLPVITAVEAGAVAVLAVLGPGASADHPTPALPTRDGRDRASGGVAR